MKTILLNYKDNKANCFLFLITIFICSLGFSQNSINDYKYVIVESQFHFQKEANEYNLNELTRFLLKKQGFRPILDNEIYPEDLKSNICLAMTSKVTVTGTFISKITIILKNCNLETLVSFEAKTKEKEFKKIYDIGIRKAFENFDNVNYEYIPNPEILARGNKQDVEIEKLKAEIVNLKTEQNNQVKIIEDVKEEKTLTKPENKNDKSFLKAKSIPNGFELLSSKSNKVEFTIYKTGMDNVFTIKGKDGLIYKKGNKWIREYIEGDKTTIETLDIKF